MKNKLEDGKFYKFLSMLKQLLVKIILAIALEKILEYSKFMKDLVTIKRMVFFELVDNLNM